MENSQPQIPSTEISSHISWGHFGIIVSAIVLLLGVTWFSKPELFSLKNNSSVSANQGVPQYYAYVPPADDLAKPEVLGASTDQGPEIINEDGTVSPADAGQVLGANTQDAQASLDSISVRSVADSDSAIKNYLSQDAAIETSPIEDGSFETALSSNSQDLLNKEIAKLVPTLSALQKLTAPAGFVNLQKFKIIEYNSAIALLKDFPQMDQNPQLVGSDLEEFLSSQQQLSGEINSVAQKYNLDANAIGPAGEAAVLSGVVQGASQGASEAATQLAQQASSTSQSFLDSSN